MDSLLSIRERAQLKMNKEGYTAYTYQISQSRYTIQSVDRNEPKKNDGTTDRVDIKFAFVGFTQLNSNSR